LTPTSSTTSLPKLLEMSGLELRAELVQEGTGAEELELELLVAVVELLVAIAVGTVAVVTVAVATTGWIG
jgi:hypothetical protein